MWLFLLWSENIAEYCCVHIIAPLNHQAWYFAETNYAAIASMHARSLGHCLGAHNVPVQIQISLIILSFTEKNLAALPLQEWSIRPESWVMKFRNQRATSYD